MSKRTNRPPNRRLPGCAVLFIVAAALVLGLFILSDTAAAPFYLSAIQRTVDEQCGQGNVVVESGGFTRDPVMSWWDRETHTVCTFNDAQDKWICNCSR